MKNRTYTDASTGRPEPQTETGKKLYTIAFEFLETQACLRLHSRLFWWISTPVFLIFFCLNNRFAYSDCSYLQLSVSPTS